MMVNRSFSPRENEYHTHFPLLSEQQFLAILLQCLEYIIHTFAFEIQTFNSKASRKNGVGGLLHVLRASYMGLHV